MAERDLYPAILLAISGGQSDCRLFRANSGVAWQGDVISQTPERLILARPRAVRLGPEGMSDLIGWSNGGRFTALEIKYGRGRPTAAQQSFVDAVKRAGGVAGVAWSVEDARKIICP